MNAWRERLALLRQELAAKPRLRLGAWAALAIVLAYVLLLQGDRLAAARAAHADEAGRLALMAGALGRDDWAELLETEQANAKQLDAALWQADSAGHAQAQLQQALTTLAAEQGLRSARIQPGVSQPVACSRDVVRVQAQLTARYDGGAALEMLLALAESERRFVVDRLTMQRRGRSFTLLVSAYFTGFTGVSE